MKHIVRSLVIVGAAMAASSAGAETLFGDFNPYVGADYYHAWMKGKDGQDVNFGNVFPKSYPGATLYVGNKFTETFGLELGFDASARKKKDFTGTNPTTGAVVTGSSKVRRAGWHLDVVGFIPMNEGINFIGSIGYGWVRPKIDATTNQYGALAFKTKDHSVIRVGAGADWMATDVLGLRAKLGWESTSLLRIQETSRSVNNEKVKAFKDSLTLAVGAFFKF